MKTFPLYQRQREAFQALQQKLAGTILRLCDPDKILLLGATLNTQESESIFTAAGASCERISACTVLVLLPEFGNKEALDWQDQLETNCSQFLTLTSIVMKTTGFLDWLAAGNYFAGRVWLEAPVLYDSGRIDPEQVFMPPDLMTENEGSKHGKEGFCKAGEFLEGAELYRIRKQNKMAAFMLHQAAEQALHCLMKSGTGYYANTHNMDRLLRYACLVMPSLQELFPRQTEQEKRLLNLLQKAYIEARYREEYKISDAELRILEERVRRLLALVEQRGIKMPDQKIGHLHIN
jgi:HEPN domain-containing protein